MAERASAGLQDYKLARLPDAEASLCKTRFVRKARPASAACFPVIRSQRPGSYGGAANWAAFQAGSRMMTKISYVESPQFDAGRRLPILRVALGGRARSPSPNPSTLTIRPGCLPGHERERRIMKRHFARRGREARQSARASGDGAALSPAALPDQPVASDQKDAA